MNSLHVFSPLLFLLLLHGGGAAACGGSIVRSCEPCKTLVVYLHDIIYDGKNEENSTSAIVAAPEGRNKILPEGQNIVVFDDPLTWDENLNSSPVGRAQGFYAYIKKDLFTSWWAFSLVFNSTEYKGTINIAGSNPHLDITRDMPVTGGTGDFFMVRGVATFTTSEVEGTAYFRVKIEVNLYECW